MVSALISRIVILVFGTLYPAYASYKAVRTKNVKEYVKWMMYWIVFALFTCVETFSDVLLSWMPFYYEVKIVFVVWLLSPMTKGSSFLFKKFVHPHLARREKKIDDMIAQARSQSYTTLLTLGTRGLAYASQMVVRTAIMGQSKLVDHLRRSYSTSDLSNDGSHVLQRHKALDEDGEDELDNRLQEDQAELDNRSKVMRLTRSSSSASTGLHSVKEEDEEDEEVVTITEEYIYPVTTQLSPKEQKQINMYGTIPRSYTRKRISRSSIL
ncbi:receptor expression-enhancing protein 1-like isoform X2 [Babylonia areolata]|uniref:receptor expression-enhancing protein 1-like isoform X2 n=1 Tax=Babylonia areolata TaxID=304850 RepID=UPI003FD0121F